MSAPDRRLRRTLLMTPGNRPERMLRALATDADALVFDLEDGVPPAEKARGRACIAQVLAHPDVQALAVAQRERCVRINAPDTADALADIAALPLALVDSLMVPKVESAAALCQLQQRLDALGAFDRERPLEIIATLETPRGVLNALAVADATPCCTALFFGSGDYTSALGAAVNELTLHHPRAVVCAAAAAAGLQAIDAAYFADVKNTEATDRDARHARQFGFAGKVVFHPLQVDVVNAVFSPTADELERARRLVDTYRASLAAGRGTALTADGGFVAVDLVPPAERLLRTHVILAERAARRAATTSSGTPT